MTLAGWDDKEGGGWRSFKVDVPQFARAFARHDQVYDEVRAALTAQIRYREAFKLAVNGAISFNAIPVYRPDLFTKRLKDYDREFLHNMLRAALIAPTLGDKVALARKAWLFYRAARLWARLVRPELEAYRPTNVD